MKLLVIDDEEDDTLLFKQRFRKEILSCFMEISFAFNGKEAIKLIQDATLSPNERYIILRDLNLSDIDGMSLFSKLRSLIKTLINLNFTR